MDQPGGEKPDLAPNVPPPQPAPDLSNAVGSLMIDNSRNAAKVKRWAYLLTAFQVAAVALTAVSFYAMYNAYRSQQRVTIVENNPLAKVKVESGNIAQSAINFDQLSPELKSRILKITSADSSAAGLAKLLEGKTTASTTSVAGVSKVSSGLGLSGGPITSTGVISIDSSICGSNQRLSWTSGGFDCQTTNVINSVNGPIAYNPGSGDLSCPTCLTSVGTAIIAAGDSGINQSLNIGDTLNILGGSGISTVGSLGNNITVSLSDTAVTPNSYGSASSAPSFTVDSKGRITAASSTPIALNASAITGGALAVARGGTGVDGTAATNGKLLIGNGSGYSLSNLTQGGPITVTNGAGTITLDCPTCLTSSSNGDVVAGTGISLSGTATGRLLGSGNLSFGLANTGVTGASYGSATSVATFTVDAQGRLTTAGSTTIAGLTSANLSASANIVNSQLQNSGITINSGNGLTGGGATSLGGSASLAISAPTCLTTERLSWSGSAFTCGAVEAGTQSSGNKVYAGPANGSLGAPSFRSLVPADLGTGTPTARTFLDGSGAWLELFDTNSKIKSQYLASSGSLTYRGTWNATTNSPALSDNSGGGASGDLYIVSVAGNTTIDGNTGWQVGDWAVSNGTVWTKIANTSAVSSVNGQTGVVSLDTSNIAENGSLYFTNARVWGALSGTGPISFNGLTGAISCPTCVTTSGNGDIVAGTGVTASGTLSGRLIGTGNVTFGLSTAVPTSVVNDTNVTGSIASNALTLGWTGTLSTTRGGTGVDGHLASNGSLLIGNGTGYSLANITATGPLGVTNGIGTINLTCSTCVTTSGNGAVTSTGGDVTFTGTTTGRLIGTGNVNFDLTATAVTPNSYGSASSVATFTVDSKGRLTAAANSAIAIAASQVTSGQIAIANGGTGLATAPTSGQILIGNVGGGYTLASISGGGPITSTGGSGTITLGCATCVTTSTTLFTAHGDTGTDPSVASGQTLNFTAGTGLTSSSVALSKTVTFGLANTAVTAASYGSASSVATFTVDAQGRLTTAASTAIVINGNQVTAGVVGAGFGGTGLANATPTSGSILVANGTSYTLTACTASQFACNGGNLIGGVLTLGTNDGNAVYLRTNTTNRFIVSANSSQLQGQGDSTITTANGSLTIRTTTGSIDALSIDSGGTGDVSLGTGTSYAKNINIGNAIGATAANITSGTGGIALLTTTTGALSLKSGTSGSVTLDSGTTGDVLIGNGSSAKLIRIGTTGGNSGAAQTIINSGLSGTVVSAGVSGGTGATGGGDVTINPLGTLGTIIFKTNNTQTFSMAAGGVATLTGTGATSITSGAGLAITSGTSMTLQTASGSSLFINASATGAAGNVVLNAVGSGTVNLLTNNTVKFSVANQANPLITGQGATTYSSTGSTTLSAASNSAVNITAAGTGIMTIATGSGQLNIGTVGAKPIIIGNTTGTSGTTINTGSGGLIVNGGATASNISFTAGSDGGTSAGNISLTTAAGVSTNGTITIQASGGDYLSMTNASTVLTSSGAMSIYTTGSDAPGLLQLYSGNGSTLLYAGGTAANGNFLDIATPTGAGDVLINAGNYTGTSTTPRWKFSATANTLQAGATGTVTGTGNMTYSSGIAAVSTFGGANVTLDSNSTGYVRIGSTNNGAKQIDIGGQSTTGVKTINVGTTAAANVITIGSTTTSNTTNINSDATNIGTTAASTIHIADGAFGSTITIGSTTTGGTVAISAPAGGITINGAQAAAASNVVLCLSASNVLYKGSAATTCNTSSQRYKHDIATLDNSLGIDAIRKLRPVSFTYNDSTKNALGFIAEEVAAIDTRPVEFDDQGRPNALDYDQLIPITVNGLKNVDSRVTALENAQALAAATFSGGIVANDSEFQGKVVFDALTTFKNQVVFSGTAQFDGKVKLSGDSAGAATVAAGTTTVSVHFSSPYPAKPLVQLTPVDYDDKYKLTNVTTTGFDIVLNAPPASDVEFNWLATQR